MQTTDVCQIDCDHTHSSLLHSGSTYKREYKGEVVQVNTSSLTYSERNKVLLHPPYGIQSADATSFQQQLRFPPIKAIRFPHKFNSLP